jgi:hypothetical protein
MMHKSSSKLGNPVLLNMPIISIAWLGLILISFKDGWSEKSHAAMSLRIFFPVLSVIIGGSPPSLGRPKTHLALCSVTQICLAPIWIIMSARSNLFINQLRNTLLSSDFAASHKIPPNLISCIIVCIDSISAVDMNDLMMDGEHRAIWECVVLLSYKLKQICM